MNNQWFEKITLLVIALFLHQTGFGFAFISINWLVIVIAYFAITNHTYGVLPFFLIGIALDLIDSETLGFYSIYCVLIGGSLSYFRIFYLNTDLVKQLSIFFLANVSFLLFLDFMNLINSTPFTTPERWFSVFTTTLIWAMVQLILIPRYINQIRGYEK